MKLLNFMTEEFGGEEFDLPKNHKPFMDSKKGFSCSVCKFYRQHEGKHICMNKYFKNWSGSNILDIKDPTEWCSDWFEPMK